MFLRLLYRIFRTKILKLYHLEQAPKGFDKMEKAFVDSNGRVYYRYARDLDMPMARFRECQKMLQIIKSGLSEDTIIMIIAHMREALNGGKKPNIARIGHLIEEMALRNGVFVDPEMLFKTAALMYIREDENPAEIDQVKHQDKIKQLKIDSAGGLYDFFYSTGITAFIPFVGTTEEEFAEYLSESAIKLQALEMYLTKHSIEQQSS